MKHIRLERYNRGAAFVELSRQENVLLRTFGKIGAKDRQKREEAFSGWGAAERAFARQIGRLTHKGYWPGRHNVELIETIRNAPDDPAGYIVYGDWLLEQDDPRGFLITEGPDRFDELLEDFRLQLVPGSVEAMQLEWELGFVREIRIPFSWWARLEGELVIARVLRHPSCHFVAKLVLGGDRAEYGPSDAEFGEFLSRMKGRVPAHVQIELSGSYGEAALQRAEFVGYRRYPGRFEAHFARETLAPLSPPNPQALARHFLQQAMDEQASDEEDANDGRGPLGRVLDFLNPFKKWGVNSG